MKILKFGGTSVGSIEGLQQIRKIISNTNGNKIVVCSAMSGVTDTLLNLTKHIKTYDEVFIHSYINILKDRHYSMIEELFFDEVFKKNMKDVVDKSLNYMLVLSKKEYSEDTECEIITYGERLLTEIYSAYLNSIGVKNVLLDARDFMIVDKIERPNVGVISKKLKPLLEKNRDKDLFITQGFIRVTSNGDLRHLDRGGSDYSATLIGAALTAEEVQIWSDVDGFHNCDPRVVKDTFLIPYLSYDEAAELACFGAKILHPQTVFPAKKLKIPLLLRNTFHIEGKGTVISNETSFLGRRAISVKNNLMSLKMTYLSKYDKEVVDKKIVSEFEKNNITIYFRAETEDYIEVSVLQQIKVYKILDALERLVEIDFKKDLSIVCIVGYHLDYDSDVKLKEEIKQLSINEIFCHSDILSTKIGVDSENIDEILKKINSQLLINRISV
ncbi:aspartate kinase [Flavobacterium sp. '19STA2R22 D10 B1']|uniref:aspartate kinase n=1 Tax=Flavobacterium aerium TaxID=3037261 RepID=UPI00278C676B|nr:aspartate kinase [Flavobacterium sp. '19STA2R22 D10 B1']